MYRVNNKWKYPHNSVLEQKSRILIVWAFTFWSNITMHADEQYITCILHNARGASLICTVVCAYSLDQRTDLWHYLTDQASFFRLPWVILGDFNAILSSQERINQEIHTSLGEIDFMNCVNAANLHEPEFTGNFYTWKGTTTSGV